MTDTPQMFMIKNKVTVADEIGGAYVATLLSGAAISLRSICRGFRPTMLGTRQQTYTVSLGTLQQTYTVSLGTRRQTYTAAP